MSSNDEPMVMLTCRVPRMLRDRVDELKAASGAEDRSEVIRRLLADGTRRALAAANHPARLALRDHQPDPAAGPRAPHEA